MMLSLVVCLGMDPPVRVETTRFSHGFVVNILTAPVHECEFGETLDGHGVTGGQPRKTKTLQAHHLMVM